ncbi:MAG: alpha/beta hydrolase [Cyanobacteriota bacterium]|nr:alpha/beta hydrolase [Cyanobacteriota bacterium]
MAPADVSPPAAASPQVIAMHGWAGDSRQWRLLAAPLEARGWRWCGGERGYGDQPPEPPRWRGPGRKVVIAHSLGPHLLPAEVWAAADAVVLLASFGRFLPAGVAGRRLRAALAGMDAALADTASARAMLRSFLAEAAAPDPPSALPSGPADGPLGPLQLERLRADLALLERTEGLPPGFPDGVPVLLVEAGEDRIVAPEARALLRQALPRATHLPLPGAGHALLTAPLVEPLLAWLDTGRLAPPTPGPR